MDMAAVHAWAGTKRPYTNWQIIDQAITSYERLIATGEEPDTAFTVIVTNRAKSIKSDAVVAAIVRALMIHRDSDSRKG